MKYEIKGGNFPVVTCTLSSGEQMITEKGSMVWMSANIEMETQGGGLGKMFSKAFSADRISAVLGRAVLVMFGLFLWKL